VLTPLGRAGSPVFRYRTGDRVRLARDACPCGRTFARLEGGILGRLDDMLIVRGVNVFPSAVEGIVRRHPDVGEFKIVVESGSTHDELRVVAEIDPVDARTAPELRAALRSEIGIRIEVVPTPPGSLPRHEHKARRLERRRSPH
jgi:phenylacetate-CoA ligase